MLVRIATGVGLFALGFFLGREIGRTEPIREELRHARGARRSAAIIDIDKDGRTTVSEVGRAAAE